MHLRKVTYKELRQQETNFEGNVFETGLDLWTGGNSVCFRYLRCVADQHSLKVHWNLLMFKTSLLFSLSSLLCLC